MNLYEIEDKLYNLIENGFDAETGEILEGTDLSDSITACQMELTDKISNIACMIKNLQSDAEALKAEKAKLANATFSVTAAEEIKSEVKADEAPAKKNESEKIVPVSDPAKYEGVAVKFLEDVFKAMELEAQIKTSFELSENALDIELLGSDMGILIGKRGATLDSLQYLVSLVVNKESEQYIRVKVDTEDYRERRRATLENLAKNVSSKVKRTGRPYELESMNPYERRIIHSALQDNDFVYTYSEGEGSNRHIVVALKEGVKPTGDRGRYNGRRGRRY